MQLLVCLQATQPTFTPELDRTEVVLAVLMKLEINVRYETVTASNKADTSQKAERLVKAFLVRLPALLRICPSAAI